MGLLVGLMGGIEDAPEEEVTSVAAVERVRVVVAAEEIPSSESPLFILLLGLILRLPPLRGLEIRFQKSYYILAILVCILKI